jgi:RimJ/RimL family protein N-acetyltransferase
MIRTRAQPEHGIGSISLYDQPGNHRGFWLMPQWQGHGYMREACKAINHHWFETLRRPLMQVPKAIANQASRKVSQHEGMRMIGTRGGEPDPGQATNPAPARHDQVAGRATRNARYQ